MPLTEEYIKMSGKSNKYTKMIIASNLGLRKLPIKTSFESFHRAYKSNILIKVF